MRVFSKNEVIPQRMISEDEENKIIIPQKRNKKQANRLKKLDQAEKLFREGFLPSAIAKSLKMNYRSLNHHFALANTKVEPTIVKSFQGRKITEVEMKVISNFISRPQNRVSSLRQIREELSEKCSDKFQTLSLETIRKCLKRLGYIKKRARIIPIARNSERVLELRRQNVLTLTQHWINGKIPIFLDETGLQSDLITNYMYCRRGKPLILDSVVRSRNVSTIFAITNDYVIGYQSFKGGVTAADFAAFIINLLKINKDIWDNLANYALILDNASCHKAKEIQEFLSHLPITYLAPYSPFLTPIEEYFSQLKANFRKLRCRGLKDVVVNIFHSMKKISYSLIPNIFHHSLSFYPRCIWKSAII